MEDKNKYIDIMRILDELGKFEDGSDYIFHARVIPKMTVPVSDPVEETHEHTCEIEVRLSTIYRSKTFEYSDNIDMNNMDLFDYKLFIQRAHELIGKMKDIRDQNLQ